MDLVAQSRSFAVMLLSLTRRFDLSPVLSLLAL